MDLLDVINAILLSYFVPLVIAYIFAKVFYSMKDEFGDEPDGWDMFFILCPGVNILSACVYPLIAFIRLLVRKEAERDFHIGYWFLKIKKED